MSTPATTTGTVPSLLSKNDQLVLKGLDGGVLLGRWPECPIIDDLVAPSAGQLVVPTALESIGHIGEDGLTHSSEDEVVTIPAWGSAQYVRRDIQRRDLSLQFLALEDRRLSRELYEGIDLSAVELPVGSDQITYDQPLRPPQMYWRVLTISTDGLGDNFMARCTFYPKMSVNERDDYTEADGEDTGRNVTLGSAQDDEAGFAARQFIVGPGVRAYAEAMGWLVAS